MNGRRDGNQSGARSAEARTGTGLARGRSMTSFNTPENIRFQRQWERFLGRTNRATYPSQLPAHYASMAQGPTSADSRSADAKPE